MVETIKKLIEEVEEFKSELINKCGSEMIEDMDETEFVLIQKAFKILSTSEEVMLKQAEMFRINKQ